MTPHQICSTCGLTTYSDRLMRLVGEECPRCGTPVSILRPADVSRPERLSRGRQRRTLRRRRA